MADPAATAEAVARQSYGRLLAWLAARNRDLTSAEDALAEAFARALKHWPKDGVPDNPEAWLLVVARRELASGHRRRHTRKSGEAHLALIAEELEEAQTMADLPDRRLMLIFACAHPSIDASVRPALILQTMFGFNAEQIASAFLIAPSTMGQRLVRGKSKIRDAGIPFRIPESGELPERLHTVLEAIYAAFTREWIGQSGDAPADFAGEAIYLGRLVAALLPDEAEALGLLSLMLHAEARRTARTDEMGAFMPLSEQDTERWDYTMLAEAEALLDRANRLPGSGRFQIEAAIQSVHASRRITGATDWWSIIRLYDHLVAITHSPIAIINRAAATAAAGAPDAALKSLEEIEKDKRLATYQPWWALRGHLLEAVGAFENAAEAYSTAIVLAPDPAMKNYLSSKKNGIGKR